VVCLSGALKKGWPPVLMHKWARTTRGR
jgi:hypothetical protein